MIEHYWDKLKGPRWFSAADIYRRQVESAREGAKFVEVGAWKGRSTCFMAVEIVRSGKSISFFTVDHWLGSPGEAAHESDKDVKQGRLFDVFKANIEPVAHCVTIIRDHSESAAWQFADGDLDFVYIDAGHTYSDVMSDLRAWWPKIRPGGVMAGDDWCFLDEAKNEFGVRRAVQEFFAEQGREIRVEPGMPNPEWQQWLVENLE